jgi:heparan-alpha-glucosaminide N-acetyltransferase
MPSPSLRIAAIDVLRALTMLLMIFVNDLWSLSDIPSWLEHTAAEEDGMGLADVVFPAFLFLVGMSIPLGIMQRQSKGESNGRIFLHIIERSVALLVMGLFLVNGENINETASGIARGYWNMISCGCFILLWNRWPSSLARWIIYLLKTIAILTLLFLAWKYRSGNEGDLSYFEKHWWGILGLIGWAYFVSAVIFLFTGGNMTACVVAWIVFVALNIANHAGNLPDSYFLQTIISPIGEGAMTAFSMGGAVMTLLLLHFRKTYQNKRMIITFLIIAVLLIVAGFYLRGFWGISKIRATPAWVLICSGITIACFVPLYWLTDIRDKKYWFKLIEPAGTNTLLCYLLPYFAYAIMGIIGWHLPKALLTGGMGLLQSLLFSLLMILIAGRLGKAGIKLKL